MDVDREFLGAPRTTRESILRIFGARGESVRDGMRLGAINVLLLIAAAMLLVVVRLFNWILGSIVSIPLIFPSFFALLLLLAAGAYIVYTYSVAHGRAARRNARAVRSDVFGAIAAIPFALIGIILMGNALLGLFFATITFSLSRAGDSAVRFAVSLLFFGLALATLLLARAAAD